jgi:hypothetical protein
VDGFTALDKMRENFEKLCNNVPILALAQGTPIMAISMYAHCISELEYILTNGVVNYDNEAIQKNASFLIKSTLGRRLNIPEDMWYD